jgi:hypothetical protein
VRLYNNGGSEEHRRNPQSATFEDFTINDSEELLIAA